MNIDFKEIGVPMPLDSETVVYQDGNTQDIIRVILYADAQSRKKNTVGKLPEILRGSTDFDTCSNVWDFVKENMTYKTDKAGFEKVKSPNWMIYYRVGDCKSYSVLIAALLRGCGIHYRYRFVGFDDDTKNPTHVYIVAYPKVGREVIIDAVHTAFDDEPRHTFNLDKSPSSGVSGIRL